MPIFFNKIRSFFGDTTRTQWVVFVAFVVFLCIHFYLMSHVLFFDSGGSLHSTFYGYGDTPYHLTQVTKFGYSSLTNLNEPTFLGEKLHYPFFINFLSGMLVRITGSLVFSFLLPAYIFIFLNACLVYQIYKKCIGKARYAVLGLFIFFLGTGFAGYGFLQKAYQDKMGPVALFEYLSHNNLSTTVIWQDAYPEQSVIFGTPMVLSFLHQRAFLPGLFGFSLFLLLLIKMWQERGRVKRSLIIATAIVFGILPIMHTHSFVCASIVFGVFGLFSLFYKRFDLFKKYLFIAILGGLVALPQIWYLVGTKTVFSASATFISYRLGWMSEPAFGGMNFPTGAPRSIFSWVFVHFTFLNFGAILIAFLLAWLLYLLRNRMNFVREIFSRAELPILLGFTGLLIFVIGQLFRFQPWDFDNNKIFEYYQFFAVPFILFILSKIYDKKKTLGVVLLVIFTVLSIFSGILEIVPRLIKTIPEEPVIFSPAALRLADFIKTNIPEGDLIVTGTTHLNPVASLAGRGVLVGYPGWLWTHGINYGAREEEIKKFYANPSKSDLAQKYNAKYALFDSWSVSDFKADKKNFDARFQKVFEEGEYTLYKI
ncbi:MAG: hypothetical protein PHS53_00395 [Candidatus Pacebacteria bacterium]|nr:hypothetical protein [Candidatus Paceibacterota bacterium]MDD5356596.1 hypothetical protein [Candidatus Paceibacterota bacterium]